MNVLDVDSPEPIKLGRMTVILLAMAAAIVATATAIYLNFTRLTWAERWIRHTMEVSLALDRSVMAVVSAERAARGFVLTADRQFLDHYTTAVRDAQDELYKLQNLTLDNEAQQLRVQLLNKHMKAVLRWSSNLIAAADSSEAMDAANHIVTTARGYALTTAYRGYVQEMRQEEESLLAERTAMAEKAQDRSLLALGLVTAISLVALPLLGFAVRREAQRIADARFARIEASFGTTANSLR
jgi:CHASE3 domain sensor protein